MKALEKDMDVVVAELERSLVMLEAQYRKAVSNLNRLRGQMEKDDLTGLLRRGAFMNKLRNLLLSSREEGREVHVIMIDVDHFKRVNDTYGHQTGDLVLERLSALVGQYMRPTDLAGRYGGEEIIVAIQADSIEAMNVAENIRRAVESCRLMPSNGRHSEFCVTLSAGLASTRHFGHFAENLIGEADAALYKAKTSGRNRVVAAQEFTVDLSVAQAWRSAA